MDAKGYLNVNDLRKIWKEEFLPSIKRELKSELEALRTSIKTLTARVDGIEKSLSFIYIYIYMKEKKCTRNAGI